MIFLKIIYLIPFCGMLGYVSMQQVTPSTTKGEEPRRECEASFSKKNATVPMGAKITISMNLTFSEENKSRFLYKVQSKNENLAKVEEKFIKEDDLEAGGQFWQGNITIDGIFIGQTNISVIRVDLANNQSYQCGGNFTAIIIRQKELIDHIFVGSLILLMSILYLNFGAVLDLSVLKTLVSKPVGPSIGLISQFLMMPLLSYALGFVIFPESPQMRLGLYFTGISPSGGASNIWTVILGGNVNLSVLMTTLSNLSAFILIPFWLFTLGTEIFDKAKIEVPYSNIMKLSFGLVVPLLIGVAIQKYSTRLSRISARILKPLSTCLLLFIIIFAIITNLYIFQLFSWKIALAGFALPFLGYFLGGLAAKSLKQNFADCLTIAVETGIQNTGIAIYMLSLGLDPPENDLTTVIPVSVAIMTPLPLFVLYVYNRFANRNIKYGLTEEQVARGEYSHD